MGHNRAKFESAANAGLVEAREESMAEEGLKMRVDVDFVILWVLVEVQTCRVDNVGVFKLECHSVCALDQGCPGQLDPVSIKLDLAGLPVDTDLTDLLSLEVEEERFFCHRDFANIELQFVASFVATFEGVSQAQKEGVCNIGDQTVSLDRLVGVQLDVLSREVFVLESSLSPDSSFTTNLGLFKPAKTKKCAVDTKFPHDGLLTLGLWSERSRFLTQLGLRSMP